MSPDFRWPLRNSRILANPATPKSVTALPIWGRAWEAIWCQSSRLLAVAAFLGRYLLRARKYRKHEFVSLRGNTGDLSDLSGLCRIFRKIVTG